jgi:hypothetical protein
MQKAKVGHGKMKMDKMVRRIELPARCPWYGTNVEGKK